jgi:hypothetical protein
MGWDAMGQGGGETGPHEYRDKRKIPFKSADDPCIDSRHDRSAVSQVAESCLSYHGTWLDSLAGSTHGSQTLYHLFFSNPAESNIPSFEGT